MSRSPVSMGIVKIKRLDLSSGRELIVDENIVCKYEIFCQSSKMNKLEFSDYFVSI